MTPDRLAAADLDHHLLRMRVTVTVFFITIPVAAALIFVIPNRAAAAASPHTVTLVAIAAALWVGFTANRDAERRLERIRTAGAVHGDEKRLLLDHWRVYVAILVRLEMLPVAGVVVAVWGMGPAIGVWLVLLGGLMIGLTWPTARKTQLLLGRVRAMRGVRGAGGPDEKAASCG